MAERSDRTSEIPLEVCDVAGGSRPPAPFQCPARQADAERHGDADALATLLADDFVAIGPRGFVLNRQQWLDRYRSGVLKIQAFAWDDVSVREYGTAAVAVGVVTQQASCQGQDASGRFRVTQIAVQRAGRWLFAGIQYSGPIPDVPLRQE